MTQEDKDLLLKDLCARLPYGVCYKHFTWDDEREEECIIAAKIYSINSDGYVKNCYDDETVYIDDVRPYLFPLSSMTEEQCYELASIRSGFQDCWKYIKTPIPLSICNFEQIDWFNKNHFDYKGLIKKGLAIDATGLDIY